MRREMNGEAVSSSKNMKDQSNSVKMQRLGYWKEKITKEQVRYETHNSFLFIKVGC